MEKVVAPQASETVELGNVVAVRRGEGRSNSIRVRKMQRGLRAFSPFLLLLIWEAASRSGVLDVRFFPAPSMIVETGVDMATSGQLLDSTLETLKRLFFGYVIGSVVAVIVGLWLGLSSWARSLLEPWIHITYPIPKLAVYPLLLLIVGLGDLPMILVLAIAVFYIVVLNTIAAVLSISSTIVDVGRDHNANFRQFFFTIAFPATLPQIITGLEIALGISYLLAIATEFLSSNEGLGHIIWASWETLDVKPMYVALCTITVAGFLSTIGLRALGQRLTPWTRQTR